jgi:UDP-N-acetylglucosamine 2-epimerase
MIVSVVGARPQFVKAAVVSKGLERVGLSERLVHTGQHYDDRMSDVFWRELGLPPVTLNLAVGSGTHAQQTARMMEGLEAYLLELQSTQRVDAVLLYGDTNSTLAGSVVAAKLNIPIIHVEAGLRSFNRTMPEEVNRVVTDHLSTILFCSSPSAVRQLESEGIRRNVHDVGDVMYDAVLTYSTAAEDAVSLGEVIPMPSMGYNLLTLHRPHNTDDDNRLRRILGAVADTGEPVVWPVHPRLRKRLDRFDLPLNLHPMGSFSYLQMLLVLKNARKVFTDSGGLQKEAYWLGKTCITLREETEWTETLHHGWNSLVGDDPEKIRRAFAANPSPETWKPLYGDGKAADRIAAIIKAGIPG